MRSPPSALLTGVGLALLLATTTSSSAAATTTIAPPSSPAPYNVAFSSPTPFDGTRYADGMPVGNGDVVALVWGNLTNGGLDFFVRSALAMHTDSTLFTIARVQLAISPNPFSHLAYWNQSLDLETGTVTLLGGGTNYSDWAVAASLYVDANSNTIMVGISARDGSTLYSVEVTVHSPRPTTRFEWQGQFYCNKSSSGPDVLLPPAPNVIGLYHVNSVAAGDMAFFAETLRQQHLESLLSSFADPLDGRIFGLAVTGAAGADGSGTALTRTSPASLTSPSAASAFLIKVTVLVMPDAAGDEAEFVSALSAAVAAGPPPAARAAASIAWWASFWARSWIVTPAPQALPRAGVFPCGGGDPALLQTVAINTTTGVLTTSDGRCFLLTSDDLVVSVGPCGGGLDSVWSVVPCTASNCVTGDVWVVTPVNGKVWGMPGAVCPWVDIYPPDKPAGQLKNQLFTYNATDRTLRTECSNCPGLCVSVVPPPAGPSSLSAAYANTRYVQAIQSRTTTPIKFNGMMFLNQAGENGPNDVDYRQWASDNWWQNTRLPYGNMLASGDWENFATILDWASGFIPFALARTAALLPGEKGIFFTETLTIFGAYQQDTYGCAGNRPAGYPDWLENSGWMQYDFLGNALSGEGGLYALDYYAHTGDLSAAAKYVPIATHALDFYISHYHNRTADGKLVIWPTQVLETYWCAWPGFSNCCVNDMPAVAALHALTDRLLALPASSGLLTPDQRASYAALRAMLPPLPISTDGSVYLPAEVTSSGTHNAEIPELFAVHPFRLITRGRALVSHAPNLTSVGVSTWNALPLTKTQNGWYYGGMQAALLGLAEQAYADVLSRSQQPPADGYRWPYFAAHYQDYEPSADHFANLNTGLQLMLMQHGEDGVPGVKNESIVLLPAWPCARDVSFRLWGASLTSVTVVYANSSLVSLDVDPPERAVDVLWGGCVREGEARDAVAAMWVRVRNGGGGGAAVDR